MDPRTILVADDDPLQCKLLSARLTQAGFHVLTAENGAKALEKARKSRPDSVVTDVVMPGLDGFGLCRTLRLDAHLAAIPVVLLTSATVEEADLHLARSVGANAFLMRTPDYRDVIEALERGWAQQVPPSLWEDSTRNAWLRDQFLKDGREEIRGLLNGMESEWKLARMARLAHRWAGVGGTLGFPEISGRALELEELIETSCGGIPERLRTSLEEMARVFAEAAADPRGGPEPGGAIAGESGESAPAREERVPRETARALAGKRIALIGFEPEDAARLASALREARSSSCHFPYTAAPDSPIIRSFDLAILEAGAACASSPWREAANQAANGRPLLVIGPKEVLFGKAAAALEFASDFLCSPWSEEEAVLRAARILRGRPCVTLAPRPPAGPPGESARILVADDDLTILAVVAATLEDHGMRCLVSRDGAEALQKARHLRPDLLVLDVNMPGMDGFQTLSRLKEDPETSHIPVVLLTARQHEADIVRGFSLSAADYVVKPFGPMELLARIQRLLNRVR